MTKKKTIQKWRYQTCSVSDRKSDEYNWCLSCDNCGERIYVWIKNGTRIADIKTQIPCWNCGVMQRAKP